MCYHAEESSFPVIWIWMDSSPKTLSSLASFRKNLKLSEGLQSQLSSGIVDALHQFMWNVAWDTTSVDDITHSTIVRYDVINTRNAHDDTTASEMENVQSVSKCRKEEEEKEKHTTSGRRSKMWWDTVGGKDRKSLSATALLPLLNIWMSTSGRNVK